MFFTPTERHTGYWALFNTGILHRDTSEGNVLMVSPGQQLDRGDNYLGDADVTDEVLIASEKKLRDVLDQLRREPTGMLSDLDLCSPHSLVSREGTPTDAPNSAPTSSRGTPHNPCPFNSLIFSCFRSRTLSRRGHNRGFEGIQETKDSFPP